MGLSLESLFLGGLRLGFILHWGSVSGSILHSVPMSEVFIIFRGSELVLGFCYIRGSDLGSVLHWGGGVWGLT